MSAPSSVALSGGRIWTADPARPFASSVLLRDGCIAAIDDPAEVARADTHIDLAGRLAMPGVIDMHNHVLEGARATLFDLQLPGTASFDALLAAVATAAKQPNHDGWLMGGGWAHGAAAAMAGAAGLAAFDAATGDVPTVLRDFSYHSRYANSAALARAGIHAHTPDPANGEIVRDPTTGQPTGLLHESAGAMVDAAAPAYTPDQDLAAARHAVASLNACGVTGFGHAVASRSTLRAFRALDTEGALTARIATYLDRDGSVLALPRDGIGDDLIRSRHALGTARVHVDFAKFFMDGVPSMRTAAFFDPYLACEGQPQTRVAPFYTSAELANLIRPLDRDGLSVKVHAIGDRAISDTLDAIASVRKTNGPGPLHSIAHMNFIRAADIARMRTLGVVADLCPAMWFPTPAQARLRSLLGAARADGSWPTGDIVRAGVLACAGTDWPCAAPGLGPWIGLSGMVTRMNPSGAPQGVHGPDQRLDLDTALRLFTINPATALRLDAITGSIAVGKSADLIILDRDLFAIDASEIAATRVDMTLFEGRVVHCAAPVATQAH